jgi:hypothetical protein
LGAALRLVGYGAQGLAARKPEFVVILYVLPLAASVIAAAVLSGVPFIPEALRRALRPPMQEPA